MLKRALSKAKREGGKKIPINFQVPAELKEQFEDLCKKNEVSVTSMLTGLMETALEEARGIYHEIDINSLLSINHRILEIEKELEDYYRHYGMSIDHNPDLIHQDDYHDFISLKNELDRLSMIVKMFNKEEINDSYN